MKSEKNIEKNKISVMAGLVNDSGDSKCAIVIFEGGITKLIKPIVTVIFAPLNIAIAVSFNQHRVISKKQLAIEHQGRGIF